MIKIDLQKAYDSVEWIFLQQVMEALNFPWKFIRWIMECVQTVSYTVMVNGQTTEPFQAAKGLRQGDPMSPFLFTIVMEYLSRALYELRKDSNFSFHPGCKRLGITHLSFADDLLLFAKGDFLSVCSMFKLITQFTEASGLKANLNKSSVYFGGVPNEIKQLILDQLGFAPGELPFKYLGIPLSTRKMSLIQWQPLVDKITAKITSWTARKLSYAGRVQLVQTITFGIQAYWAQIFLIPAKILKMLDATCRSYIWTGNASITKKAYVAWDKMCIPKSAGGLGLMNLQLWNRAAILKLGWDLANKKDTLWIKWIHSMYIKQQQIHNIKIPNQASWMVRKILEATVTLSQQQQLSHIDCSVRKLYLHQIGQLPRVMWRNLTIKNPARPKAVFNLWLILQDRLPTKVRVKQWNSNIDSMCILCQQWEESRNHLFYHCPFTTMMMHQAMGWIGVTQPTFQSWDRFIQWVVAKAKGRTARAHAMKLIFAEVCYCVWLERNSRIFTNMSKCVSQLLRNTAYICHVRSHIEFSLQFQQVQCN